jgi:glucan 1,3-beta-glucosidase
MQANPIATMAFTPNATWHDPDFGECQGNSSCIKTWGLRVYNSSYVYIYAAGLYSFFENYQSTVCLANVDCQDNAFSLEKSGYVYVYSLYTVGTGNLVLMDNTKVVPYTHLINNTFGQSVAVFGYP